MEHAYIIMLTKKIDVHLTLFYVSIQVTVKDLKNCCLIYSHN